MHKQTKKLPLRLTTETIRRIDDAELAQAAGGASILIRCGLTQSCPGVCVQPK